MHPAKLDRILSSERELQPLLAKARDLSALSGLIESFLPRELSRQVRVVNFRDGELVLAAAHASAATKLRVLGPSLSRFLSNQRWQVSGVLVRVQPNASRPPSGGTQKTAHFSTLALDSLQRLYEGMSPSPAREALRTLLDRRGARAR